MRVLIDTNILIHREASRVINKDIGLLFNWLDRLGYEKCVHPKSLEELSGYHDPEVVKAMRAKVAHYNVLKTTAPDSPEISALRKTDKTPNDIIDTSILSELFSGRVDYLISEDRGIHRKASALEIPEKVFRIEEFLAKAFSENPELKSYKVLSVKKEFFGNIDLSDEFFSSFKTDYSEFSHWFNRKADNTAYVCRTDGEIKAFLYLKVEGDTEVYPDIFPCLPAMKRLKIGTFKVASTGLKLGERFLKIVFDNALQYGVRQIYVTIFDRSDEQLRLIGLLEDWGFRYWGNKQTPNGEEKVYVRDFQPNAIQTHPRRTYPFVSRNTRKWIVPIYPEYHTDLFPDSILSNESPEDFIESEPHRNAIRKVYISRSINRDLTPGDLLIFYRTGGHYKGVVSTLGIVESVITRIRDEEHFIELCRKRSVFSQVQLREQWRFKPQYRPFIVNFLYVDSFPTPKITLMRLRELNILHDAPRGFELMNASNFERLLKEARANARIVVD